MKDYLYPERITVRKTKVDLTVSLPVARNWGLTTEEAAKQIMVKAVVAGASANAISQLKPTRLSEKDFATIKKAQEQFNKIASDLLYDLEDSLSDLEPITHKFH